MKIRVLFLFLLAVLVSFWFGLWACSHLFIGQLDSKATFFDQATGGGAVAVQWPSETIAPPAVRPATAVGPSGDSSTGMAQGCVIPDPPPDPFIRRNWSDGDFKYTVRVQGERQVYRTFDWRIETPQFARFRGADEISVDGDRCEDAKFVLGSDVLESHNPPTDALAVPPSGVVRVPGTVAIANVFCRLDGASNYTRNRLARVPPALKPPLSAAEYSSRQKSGSQQMPLNVHFILVDSVARARYADWFAETQRLLRRLNDSGVTTVFDFQRYHVVGWHSDENTAALWTGLDSLQLAPDAIAAHQQSRDRRPLACNETLSGFFRDLRYASMFADCNCGQSMGPPKWSRHLSRSLCGGGGGGGGSASQQNHGGAAADPFHFSLNMSFYCGAEHATYHDKMRSCAQHNLPLVAQFVGQVAKEWPAGTPVFSSVYLHDMHDNMAPEFAARIDRRLARGLAQLSDAEWARSLVVLVSDHGLHYGPHLESLEGQVEHKLPLLVVSVPPALLARWPQIGDALRVNARRALVTAFDVHATIKHFGLLADRMTDSAQQPRSGRPGRLAPLPHPPPQRQSFARSLFEPIDLQRDCASAGVRAEICVCANANWTPLVARSALVDDQLWTLAAFAAHWVNQRTAPVRQWCARLRADAVRTASVKDWSKNQATGRWIKVQFTAQPGDTLFDATLYLRGAGSFSWNAQLTGHADVHWVHRLSMMSGHDEQAFGRARDRVPALRWDYCVGHGAGNGTPAAGPAASSTAEHRFDRLVAKWTRHDDDDADDAALASKSSWSPLLFTPKLSPVVPLVEGGGDATALLVETRTSGRTIQWPGHFYRPVGLDELVTMLPRSDPLVARRRGGAAAAGPQDSGYADLWAADASGRFHRPWGRCAVVGNSAILRGAGHGKAIDGHDAVFRVNWPAVDSASAADTGLRTTVMTVANRWVLDPPTGRTIDTLRRGTTAGVGVPEWVLLELRTWDDWAEVAETLLKGQRQRTMASLNGTSTGSEYVVYSRYWMSLVDRVVCSLSRNPDGPVCRASPGFRAVLTAMASCHSVSVFGFGLSSDSGFGPLVPESGTSVPGRIRPTAAAVVREPAVYRYAREHRLLQLLNRGADLHHLDGLLLASPLHLRSENTVVNSSAAFGCMTLPMLGCVSRFLLSPRLTVFNEPWIDYSDGGGDHDDDEDDAAGGQVAATNDRTVRAMSQLTQWWMKIASGVAGGRPTDDGVVLLSWPDWLRLVVGDLSRDERRAQFLQLIQLFVADNGMTPALLLPTSSLLAYNAAAGRFVLGHRPLTCHKRAATRCHRQLLPFLSPQLIMKALLEPSSNLSVSVGPSDASWALGCLLASAVFNREPFFRAHTLAGSLRAIQAVRGHNGNLSSVGVDPDDEAQLALELPEQSVKRWAGFHRSSSPDHHDAALYDLLSRLLCMEADQRLLPGDIANHSFFNPKK